MSTSRHLVWYFLQCYVHLKLQTRPLQQAVALDLLAKEITPGKFQVLTM